MDEAYFVSSCVEKAKWPPTLMPPPVATLNTELASSSSEPLTGIALNDDGVIVDTGEYDDEERDPDLYPICLLVCPRGVCFVYQYGIVALVDLDGNEYLTRMD